ncbi:MAG: DMT family transporter [Candidatus Micrarchaeota archaeon]
MNLGKGYFLVLATAVISGVSIFANKFAVTGLEPVFFTAAKNALVAVFLISALLLTRELKALASLKKRDWAKLFALGIVGGSVPFALFFTGLTMTSAAGAAFAHKTMFVFVALISVFFMKQAIDKRLVPLALVLLAGNALLIGLPGSFDFGLLLVLAATVLWSVETVYAKKLLADYSSNVVSFSRMFFGSLVLLGYLAFTNSLPTLSQAASASWPLLLTSLFLLGYVLTWFAGLKLLDPVTASIILLLGAPITAGLSIAFGLVTPAPLALLGIALLSVGVVAAIKLDSIRFLDREPAVHDN